MVFTSQNTSRLSVPWPNWASRVTIQNWYVFQVNLRTWAIDLYEGGRRWWYLSRYAVPPIRRLLQVDNFFKIYFEVDLLRSTNSWKYQYLIAHLPAAQNWSNSEVAVPDVKQNYFTINLYYTGTFYRPVKRKNFTSTGVLQGPRDRCTF